MPIELNSLIVRGGDILSTSIDKELVILESEEPLMPELEKGRNWTHSCGFKLQTWRYFWVGKL